MENQSGLALLGKFTNENGESIWLSPIVNEEQQLITQLNEEASQSQHLGSGLEYFFYADGVERTRFESVDINNGSSTKQRTHLAMVGNGQLNSTDKASFQTVREIDLSNIDTLTIDWECVSDHTSTGVRSFLYLFSRFNGSNVMVSEKRKDGRFSRVKEHVNVSHLNGKYLIRTTTQSRSESNQSTELKVYNVSGKKGNTLYHLYSTEDRPAAPLKADKLFEFDTKKVFIYDGLSWVEM